MSQIKEYKNYYDNGQPYQHYFLKDGEIHGESKEWFENGVLREHSFYKDGVRHGEYKDWYNNGQLWEHSFYKDDEDITDQVREVVVDILNITSEEKMIIKLKFGIDCL